MENVYLFIWEPLSLRTIALMRQKKSLIVKMWLTEQAGKAALIIRPLQPLLIQ